MIYDSFNLFYFISVFLDAIAGIVLALVIIIIIITVGVIGYRWKSKKGEYLKTIEKKFLK